MRSQVLPVLFFCLATGAAMGCLFLLFRGVARLLGLGRVGTAVADLLFCCLCGGFVFLCALAVDSGRLRLYQAALQLLGAWSVVVSLGPWVRRGALAVKKFFEGLFAFLAGKKGFLRGLLPARKGPGEQRGKKPGKKPKKQRKKT